MKFTFKIFLLLFTLFLITGNKTHASNNQIANATYTPSNNRVLYVNINVSGGDGSGSSWANAIPQLADALKWAKENEAQWVNEPLQIWVAGGTYKPKYRPDNMSGDNFADPANTFLLVHNVHLYGGFRPGATSINDRITNGLRTTISGDVYDDDRKSGFGKTLSLSYNTDNTKRLFMAVGGITTQIVGFQIKGAYNPLGNSSVTIGDKSYSDGNGSALLIRNSSITVNSCEFVDNQGMIGGAIAVQEDAQLKLESCVIRNNTGRSSIIYNSLSTVIISSTLFEGNYSQLGGAALTAFGEGTITKMVNATLVLNYSADGTTPNVGVVTNRAHMEIYNSIILNSSETSPGVVTVASGGEATIRKSLIQGLFNSNLYSQNGNNSSNIDNRNVTESTIFSSYYSSSPSSNNYSPKTTASTYDRADQSYFITHIGPLATARDAANKKRLVGDGLDIGAHESTTAVLSLNAYLLIGNIQRPYGGQTQNPRPEIRGTTSPNATVKITVNNVTWASILADSLGKWSFLTTDSLADGYYPLSISVSKSGYQYLSPKSLPVTIDTQKPIVTGVEDGGYYTSPVTVSYNEGNGGLFYTQGYTNFYSGGKIGDSDTYSLTVTDVAQNVTSLTFTIARPIIQPSASNILYVNKNVVGGNSSGDSWENAIKELADALVYAARNKATYTSTNRLQIWVATGTYHPLYTPNDITFGKPASPRCESFLMVNYVDLYGGFTGTETDLSQRNWHKNPTILDGDLLENDKPNLTGVGLQSDESRNDNLYNVVMFVDAPWEAVVVDGFHVVNGNARYSSLSPIVNGLSLQTINGGGIASINSFATLKNSVLRKNSASGSGGAIYHNFSSSGGFVSPHYLLTISNVLFEHNYSLSGSAIDGGNHLVDVVNSTFVYQTEASGGTGMVVKAPNASIVNSIAFNPAIEGATWPANITYSLIAPLSSKLNGNIDATNITPEQVFVDPANGNYRLKFDSPAKNVGSNSAYQPIVMGNLDLAGLMRVYDTTIDLGPYEVQESDIPLPVRLIAFTGRFEDQVVNLYWQTADELNTKHFEIERSHDGKQFDWVGSVPANQIGAHVYTYTDEKLSTGKLSYYRLRMVDQDGSYSYSRMISIQSMGRDITTSLNVYPNTLSLGGLVTISVRSATQGSLYNLVGQKVHNFSLQAGVNTFAVPQLTPGVYMLVTENEEAKRLILK